MPSEPAMRAAQVAYDHFQIGLERKRLRSLAEKLDAAANLHGLIAVIQAVDLYLRPWDHTTGVYAFMDACDKLLSSPLSVHVTPKERLRHIISKALADAGVKEQS